MPGDMGGAPRSSSKPTKLIDGNTIRINAGLPSPNFELQMTAAVGASRVIANPVNPIPGRRLFLWLHQSDTGGLNFSLGSKIKPDGGVAVQATQTSNASDLLILDYNQKRDIWLLSVIAYTPPLGTCTWNPADKDAGVVLSGGDLIASFTGGGGVMGAVRGTIGLNAAAVNAYFEVTRGGADATAHLAGIGNASASLTRYPGDDINGWSYYFNTGEKANNSVFVTYNTGASGATVGVHLNNGVLQFYSTGGVAYGDAYTGLTGTVFPMWGQGTTGAGTRTATLNVGASAWAYALPSGASAWG